MRASTPGDSDESSPGAPAPPSSDAIRVALERVLESTSFSRSSRLSRFLRFVVEKSLDGEQDKLKEYTIGVEVFDRDESFDPRVETIVRVEARRLRNQLSEYYGDAGQVDPIRFEIPKGGYRPVFRSRSAASSTPAEDLDPRTIVVLPFSDMSPRRDQAHFCDGITEELTHALAQVDWTRVIARTSAFAFKGETTDVREIGRRLGAGTALEGSLRFSEDRVRVTAQLIDTRDGRHLWSDRFDRKLGDVFQIQDEVTSAVVERLEASLGEAPHHEVNTRRRARRSIRIDAYDFYLKGRYYAYRFDRDSVATAIDCFEKSIAEDSSYAQPWAGLAEAHTISAVMGWVSPSEVMPRAKDAALKALAMDDQVAEAHASLAHVLFRHDYEWEKAESAYARALALNPGNSAIRTWYTSFLVFRQRPEEAILEARRGAELDPLSVEAQRVVVDTLYFCRRFEESIAQCELILAHHPNYYFAHFYKGIALLAKEEFAAAVFSLREANRLAASLPLTKAMLGWGLGLSGELELARECRDELLAKRKSGYVPSFLLALVSLGLGEHDESLGWLEQGLADRDSMMPCVEVAQIWDPLRSDARFTELLERMGLG